MSRGRAAVLGPRLSGAYARAQVEASARLILEDRRYGQPGRKDWPVPGFEDWCSGGILFHDLSVTLKHVGSAPLTLKLGRQDILRGNGWLVLDGSRTIYFDAARATWTGLPAGTSLELIYIHQSADAGRFPAPLNGGSWAAPPHPTTEVSLDSHALWADHETGRTPAQLADLSRHRRLCGHLITGWLKGKLARQISGHLVAEYLSPGDFYADYRQDDSHFIRAELNLTW